MKVTFENFRSGTINIYIETDTVGLKIRTSSVFYPFEHMFIWLGLIKSSVPKAELVIDEENSWINLSVSNVDLGRNEFTVEYWRSSKPRPALLKANITAKEIFAAFYSAILIFLQEDCTELDIYQQNYYKSFCRIQWNKLVDRNHPLDHWLSRIKLFDCSERVGTELIKTEPLKLDNFSGEQKCIFSLWRSLRLISYKCVENYRDVASELSRRCADLTLDMLLDDVDDNWHQENIEQVHLAISQRDREIREQRREEYLAKRNARQRAEKIMNSLQVGSLIGGIICKLNPYGAFVKVGELAVLLHKDEFSHQEFSEEEEIFRINDWVRAIVIDMNRKKMRVAISTRHLEKNPGDMLKDPYIVYATADEMAEQYRKNIDAKVSK